MKKIIIALLLLATTHVHGVKNGTSSHSIEEFLAQKVTIELQLTVAELQLKVATKDLRLKKAEVRLQELKNSGAQRSRIKALKAHMATRRSSLQLDREE